MKYIVAKLEKLGHLPEEDKRDPQSKYTLIIKIIHPKYKELAKFYMRLAYIHDYTKKEIYHLHDKYLFLRGHRIIPDLSNYYKDIQHFAHDINKSYEYHHFKRDGIILNDHPDFKSILKNVKFVAIACLVKDPFYEEGTRYLTAFDTLKRYGSPSWCISKCAGTFRNYSDSKQSIQYILISNNRYNEFKDFDTYLGKNNIGSNQRFGITIPNNFKFNRTIWPLRLFKKAEKLLCFDDRNNYVRRMSTLKRLTKRFPIEKVHNKLISTFDIFYESDYNRHRKRGFTF